VREPCSDLLGDDGWRWRVLRTSNAYNFRDPGSPDLSKSEKPTETTNQGFFSSFATAFGGERTARYGRKEARRGKGRRISLPDGQPDGAIGMN
jgi:hypothetical protein